MSDFQAPTPQQSIGFQFWKLHSLWQKEVAKKLLPHKITHTQFVLLASLRWFQEQKIEPSQKQISHLTGIDTMTLSKAIRKLEKMDLVNRAKSKEDTRCFCVSLTQHGETITPQLIHAIESVDAEVFSGVEAKEQQKLKELLFRLNQKLENKRNLT